MVMAQTACYLTRVYDFLNVKEKLHENKKMITWNYRRANILYDMQLRIRPSQQTQSCSHLTSA